jgi:hypothetical protein
MSVADQRETPRDKSVASSIFHALSQVDIDLCSSSTTDFEAIERLTTHDSAPAPPVCALEYEDRLFIEVDERSRFLKVSDIIVITAMGDYSQIFPAMDRSRLS